MNERVVEILIYIMNEIRKNQSGLKKLDLLSKDLLKQGYTEGEISSAFSWLLNKLRNESDELVAEAEAASKHAFRVLHEVELSVITTAAYGYLIQLRELGIVDELDMEQCLERAMMLGTSKVDIDDMKAIAASILHQHDGLGDGAYLFFDEQPIIQ